MSDHFEKMTAFEQIRSGLRDGVSHARGELALRTTKLSPARNRKTPKVNGRAKKPLPKTLARLVEFMPPMAIRNDVQHASTLKVVDRLMQLESLSRAQADYLETLVQLVEVYEAKHHSIEQG